ncbi:MAG TPA: hypothetical protein VGR71_10925, partial [Nitrospira sp.]|nr:hypothetical protein [Nitrospira sp.]
NDAVRLPQDEAPSHRLSTVFLNRRSARDLGPCSLAELAAVLIRSTRVLERAQGPDGYPVSRRPVPSAGARHPIELAILAVAVHDLPCGFWTLEPDQGTISPAFPDVDLERVIAAVRLVGRLSRSPAGVIFLIAEFKRTLSLYPGGGHLVWLDAGALALALHLNATDVGLGSTLVATSGQILKAGLDETRQDLVAVAFGRR